MRKVLLLLALLLCTPAFAQDIFNPPPVASTTVTGTVKIDGTTITINGSGVISAVGASAVTSKIIGGTRDLSAATGSVAYTGMGFTPTTCDSFGAVIGSTLAYVTYGGHSDSTKTSSNMFSSSATGASIGSGFLTAVDTSGANFVIATIASYDADGLTLTWTKTASPTGTFTFNIRCLK